MLPITALFASLLALFYIKLAADVIQLRKRHKVALGSGDQQPLERAIRIHGNFAEYMPLALILLGLLEFQGASQWLVAVFGTALFIGRIFHAQGLTSAKLKHRVRGMMLTLVPLAALALANIVQAAIHLTAQWMR